MSYFYRSPAYLKQVTSAVNALCGMAVSDELDGDMETQCKIINTLIGLEQATTDFIDEIGLDCEIPQSVLISRRGFVHTNERLIRHLEKIQSQGYNFDRLISTLKLENDSLRKEIDFS